MLKKIRLPLFAALLGMTLFAAPASAGAYPRHQSGRRLITSYGVQSFDVVFVGGRHARVKINGNDRSNLDLYVYDQNGNLIGRHTGFSDYGVVRWTPRWTGSFRIVVVNRGYRWNRYRIWTN